MSDLGDLLELIYCAGDRWRTVRLTLRHWHHPGRTQKAVERLSRERASGGARQVTLYGGAGAPEPDEIEHIVRVWLDGDRAREEREGPYAFPSLGVRDGDQWWLYSQEHGASTNEGDPNHVSGIGEQALGLLQPEHVLGVLRLEEAGVVEVAGRPGLLVRGTPRSREREAAFALFQLGFGADAYELVFDRERGVLLRTTGLFDGLPLTTVEVLAIAFDEEFPPDTFRFELPEGESFRPLYSHPEHVTLERAAELAPFTVLSPAEVPADWQLHVLYLPGDDRPPMPPSVNLHYHSRDASQQLNIAQTAAGEEDREEWLEWEESGDALVAGPAEPRGLEPGYARVERSGTRATLSSAELPRERLLALALSLEPAYPAR